jgi:hypothetical protein
MSTLLGEHEFEPVRGLPAQLPVGETLLWQGVPCWRRLASELFHVRAILAYFAALAGWRVAVGLSDGMALAAIVQGAGVLLVLALVAVGLLVGYAALIANSTVYTITDKRVVIRGGIAMPKTWNLPFTTVRSASVRAGHGGGGDLCLELTPGNRIAYLLLWPYARPWQLRQPQPLLRGLRDVNRPAEVLARALARTAQQRGPRSCASIPAVPVPGADTSAGIAIS